MNVSVIICTHNARPDYFGRCLTALREQTLGFEHWELLIVDNCSEQPVATRFDASWHPHARQVSEPILGLTPARLRGIRESRGDLLVFVDDDNVLAPDYLDQALGVAQEQSHLGSWSGQCTAEFEETPPEWTRRYWGNLVIREFERDVWSNLPRLPDTMPCGAGLCVRREVALHYIHLHESGQRSMALDRAGDSLVSGGDNDLAACACDLGQGIGLIAALKLKHLIPPERLTESYLIRLADGIHYSAVVLSFLRASDAEFAAYRVRLRDYVRAFASKGVVHRKIQLACLRGRRRGIDFVARLKQSRARVT